MAKDSGFACVYCSSRSRSFPTRSALNHHIAASPACLAQQRSTLSILRRSSRTERQPSGIPYEQSAFATEHPTETYFDEPTNDGDLHPVIELPPPPPPSRRAFVEDVPDEDDLRWTLPYPSESHAGGTYGAARTTFHAIRDEQILQGAEVLGPFKSEEEWEIAKWLVKNVGHNQADEFLKLALVRRSDLDFTNKDQLYRRIDELPEGVNWKCKEITQTGDLVDGNGQSLTESLEVWFRDPVECVRELLGNPLFAQHLAYAPQRIYRDREAQTQHIDEMCTASWWWKCQDRLPIGSTVAPVILSSDKTKLSQFRGDKSAWPVYLTVGNLSKEIRRSPSSHGTILLGYLPVGKFDCFSEGARSLARYQAFHACMTTILEPLIQAGTDGAFVACADGQQRRVFPVVAAYAADYPEQCLIAGCMENRCPIGQVIPDERGDHKNCIGRDRAEILQLLDAHRRGELTRDTRSRFDILGLRAIHEPFWKHLPHMDIFKCFTPDLLHQLHKGVFKDHLVKWCTALVGEQELDERFRACPSLQGLRHFKHGISHVSQWTGHEHKEMQRVFLGLVAGGVPQDVLTAVRALMDFIYLASLHSHTTTTLVALRAALDLFHAHKQAFIDHGARNPAHFNIPKYHILEHYAELLEEFGSADGFNTEWSERLHIDYAKDAYRATNRKDYVIQMTKWLARQEAVDRFTVYIQWCREGLYQPRDLTPPESSEGSITVEHMLTGTARTSQVGQPLRTLYKVGSTHPPALRDVPASAIIAGQGATHFLPALGTFLQRYGVRITPRSFHSFSLFKQMSFQLPFIPEVSKLKLRNIVRACPPSAAHGRLPAQPAQFDFALIRTGEVNENTEGTALQGLRVGLIRAIFKLPGIFRLQHHHPLIYVEWFTPFRTPDPVTGLHIISRSSRMGHVNAEIIEADRIVRNCHLMPKYGRLKDTSWTADTVIDKCKVFYLNSYVDYHTFCLFKLDHRGSIS